MLVSLVVDRKTSFLEAVAFGGYNELWVDTDAQGGFWPVKLGRLDVAQAVWFSAR